MGKKLYQAEGPNGIHEGYYYFYCPGCKMDHYVNTNPKIGATWTFNGDFEKPTFSPSLLVTYPNGRLKNRRCHSFIKNGMIQFLSDCSHELAGKTVELEDVY